MNQKTVLSLIVGVAICGAAFYLYLDHTVSTTEQSRKFRGNAHAIANALRGYRGRHDQRLPTTFAEFQYRIEGVDFGLFELCQPGVKFSESGKEVFAVGRHKKMDFMIFIYVDGEVSYEPLKE